MARESRKSKSTGNSKQEAQSILESLQAIARNQTELNDRLDDMEERLSNAAAGGAALLKLVNLFYDTDDKHISELSHISPLAARPFAEAMTLDDLTSEAVQNGQLSLNRLLILNYLRFQRSVRGRHFALGVPVLQDQVNVEGQKEVLPEFEAGRE